MIEIKKNIYWVGVRDWELEHFHGEEYATRRGSTYNSYLIKDQKTALVDTVWTPFHEEFIADLEREIGLDSIDMVVINHNEQDHAGSLGYLMDKIPDTPIYCTRNGAELVKGHFHKDWNLKVVKTGDRVNLGEYDLVFVEMPMLHWPDQMATYVAGANMLLSNDAFGQHYASPFLFNDQVDQGELFQEAIKYYANILTPYSSFAKKKIAEIKALNLPIEMIAPSHGMIWRDNPLQIVEAYERWASSYNEGTVAIVYDTMWGATRKMALAIARGLEKAGIGAKLFNVAKTEKSDIVLEIFKAKGMILGSSTINRGVLSDTAAMLEIIRGLKFQNKVGAAFGSYGWSGEAPKVISERLAAAGVEIVADPIGMKWDPDEESIMRCEAFGRTFAERMAENSQRS